MNRQVVWWSLIGLLVIACPLFAQVSQLPPGPSHLPGPQPQATSPQGPQDSQSRWPPHPTIHQRAQPQPQPPQQPQPPRQPPRPPTPPFVLTPQEQAQLDQVLVGWEQQSSKVKAFESKFIRYYYDGVFGNPDEAIQDAGKLQYAAPDKGSFQVFGEQPEHWICNGKSIFGYDFGKKQLVEMPLPSELQGQAITNSPLPFLFGSTAQKLKTRYFLRIVTPATAKGQVWIEAQPRFQADAQNFQRAEVILDGQNLLPTAIQTHNPNGKTRTVYQFEQPLINAWTPLRKLSPIGLFERDPFKPKLPSGWTKVVENPPTAQMARPPREVQR